MKKSLRAKWVVPVAALVLTVSIGSAAFAATGSSTTVTDPATSTAIMQITATGATEATTATTDKDQQRADETLLTGDALAKVQAAAVAKEPGVTVVRVETDGDGNAKYEVHMQKADGTKLTVYVDDSYNVVSVATGDQAGGNGGHHGRGDNCADTDDSTSTSGS